MQRLILAAAFAGAASLAAAQDGPESGAYLEPPGLLPLPYQGEEVGMKPEVTIIETGQERIYEYRVRGQLYMVKVQPQIGPPYYLLDTTGDGELDTRKDRVWSNMLPQWVLFSW